MNRNYAKGYRFERRVIYHLERRGFTVFRQGKSSFPDLIAFKTNLTLFIECKNVRKFNKNNPLSLLSEEEKLRAFELIKNLSIPFILAYNDNRRLIFHSIGGLKIFNIIELNH